MFCKNALKTALSVLLLFSMLFCILTGCSEKNPNGEDTSTTASANSDVPSEPAETTIYDDLPTGKYDGKTFSIYTSTHNWAICEILSEEITGDEVRDAQYARTEQVKKRLGNIEFIEKTAAEATILPALEAQVLTNTQDYQLVTMNAANAYSCAIKDEVLDISTLPGVNLEKPWWASKYNDSVNMGGKYFIAFGDLSLVYHGAFYILMFNSDMINSLHLEDPFKLVDEGNWTWAKMYEMMISAASDNGDGIVQADLDNFGLSGHRVHFKHFMVTANAFLCENDNEGLPVYNGASETFINAYTDLVNKFLANDQLVTIDGVSKSLNGVPSMVSGQGAYRDVFRQGRCLFLTEGTGALYMHKDSGIPYGIVPFPMFEAGYNPTTMNTAVYSATTGPIVPSNVSDEDFVGAVLECLCAYSYETSAMEFVKNTLSYRYVDDANSLAMVNRILANGVVDRAFAFDFGKVANTFDGALSVKSPNIATALKMLENTIKSDISKYTDAFAN